MNTLNKALIATVLALGAAAAQAESPYYTGLNTPAVAAQSMMTPSPSMSQVKADAGAASQSPYVFRGEFLIDNPAYRMTSKSSTEIRAGVPKQRVVDVYSVGA